MVSDWYRYGRGDCPICKAEGVFLRCHCHNADWKPRCRECVEAFEMEQEKPKKESEEEVS